MRTRVTPNGITSPSLPVKVYHPSAAIIIRQQEGLLSYDRGALFVWLLCWLCFERFEVQDSMPVEWFMRYSVDPTPLL